MRLVFFVISVSPNMPEEYDSRDECAFVPYRNSFKKGETRYVH